jgi:hypothetical protein
MGTGKVVVVAATPVLDNAPFRGVTKTLGGRTALGNSRKSQPCAVLSGVESNINLPYIAPLVHRNSVPVGGQQVTHPVEEGGILPDAHMLEHADRDDAFERARDVFVATACGLRLDQ